MDPKSNISQRPDERNTNSAQGDHYLDLSSTLQSQLSHTHTQLSSKFQTAQCAIDPCIFEGESLAQLRGWRECLDWLIEERVKNEEEGKMEEGRIMREERREKGKGMEAELPFSPSNLTGFLTRNHQLTQGRTGYPEPRAKRT
jgi:hypothetical protein